MTARSLALCVVLAVVVGTTAISPSCDSAFVQRNFNEQDGLKIVLLGGNVVNIVYEDREDIELTLAGEGVTADVDEDPTMIAIDVREPAGANCESDLFCGDGLRCGSVGQCEPDPYLECGEQSCNAVCDDEPDVPTLSLDVSISCGDPGTYWDGSDCKLCPDGSTSTTSGTACVQCPPDTFAKSGDPSCEQCPDGAYSDVGSSECTTCSPGEYWATSECLGCPEGEFSDGYGFDESSCFSCSTPGEYWDGSRCAQCPSGTFSPGGTDTCTPCSPGTYNSVFGASECKECPAGTYDSDGSGSATTADVCVACEAGKFSAEGGQVGPEVCMPCPGGFYSSTGAEECTECPAGANSGPGAAFCTTTTTPEPETTTPELETSTEEPATAAEVAETTSEMPETTTAMMPETTTEEMPETTAEPTAVSTESVETTTEEVAKTTTEEMVETTTEMPETTTEEMVETTAQMPETTTEQMVETTTEQMVETTTEEMIETTSAPETTAAEPETTPEPEPPCTGDDCDDFEMPSSGFKIQGVAFDSECDSGLCWVLDLLFADVDSGEGSDGDGDGDLPFPIPPLLRRSGAASISSVLYLPRVRRDAGGGYAASFVDTFDANNFPCSTIGYDPANPSGEETACCLSAFADNYLVTRAFEALVSQRRPALSYPDGACNAPDGSTLLANAGDFVIGELAPGIAVVEAARAAPGVVRAQLRVSEGALQREAAMFDAGEGRMQLFVGMAHFASTGSRVLDSAASQVSVVLQKENYWAVASYGSADRTFASYFAVRVHQVLDGGTAAQYASVSLTLDQGLQPHPATGLTPLSSIRVRKAGSGSLSQWVSACASDPPPALLAALDQNCAPAVEMCVSPAAVSAADRFARLHVPLGVGLLDPEADERLYVELALSVLDASGQEATTVLSASVSFQAEEGAVTTWCEVVMESSDLYQVVASSLIVGSSASDLGALQTLPLTEQSDAALNLSLADAPRGARSFEAGMLTLALSGEEGFFAARPAFSVQVEELLTLHVNGAAKWAELRALLDAADPFQVAVDYSSGAASLLPSPAIDALCPPAPSSFLNACAQRRDVSARVSSPTVLDLSEGAAAAARFMDGVMGGTGSAFAEGLGASFLALLDSAYAFDGRSRRGWWINSAFEWTGAGSRSLSLSQRVVMVALLSVEEAGTRAKRRLLISSQQRRAEEVRGVPLAVVDLGVDAAAVAAAVTGVPERLSVRWSIRMALGAAEACEEEEALRPRFQARLDALLRGVSRGLRRVLVVGVAADPGLLRCSDADAKRRRALLEGAEPTVELDTVMLFDEPEVGGVVPYVDAAALAAMPGVLAVTPSDTSESDIFVGPAEAAPTYFGPAASSDRGAGDDAGAALGGQGSSRMMLVLGSSAGAGVVVLAGLALLAFRRLRAHPSPAAFSDVAAVSGKPDALSPEETPALAAELSSAAAEQRQRNAGALRKASSVALNMDPPAPAVELEDEASRPAAAATHLAPSALGDAVPMPCLQSASPATVVVSDFGQDGTAGEEPGPPVRAAPSRLPSFIPKKQDVTPSLATSVWSQ